MRVLASIVLATAVAGCGAASKPTPHATPAPTVSDAELEAQMKAAMTYLDELAQRTAAAGDDCAAVAAAIEDVTSRHHATIAIAGRFQNDVDLKARSDAWAAAHRDALDAAAAVLAAPMRACEGEPRVQAALLKVSP